VAIGENRGNKKSNEKQCFGGISMFNQRTQNLRRLSIRQRLTVSRTADFRPETALKVAVNACPSAFRHVDHFEAGQVVEAELPGVLGVHKLGVLL
jgi:hypothetical protein